MDLFSDVGFGIRTDLGFVEEPRVRLPNLNEWTDEKLLDITIGRGFMATPAQILQAYIPFANEGKMYRLNIWKDIKTKYQYSTLMTPNAARTIKESMKIETPAAPPFSFYGKSTLVSKPNFSDENNKDYVGVFVGLAEFNSKKLAIITVINEPKKQVYADDIAKQISTKIINESIAVLGRYD
jgi:cell division protein FtsI (penicillin-binding protein 3)